MEGDNIHQRLLKLRDVALGFKKAVGVKSDLNPATYDCATDALLALYHECTSNLAKDSNILRFIKKYEKTVLELDKLRVSIQDFDTRTTIGRGHFGEVMLCYEKSTRDVFAMKVMKKAHILQQPDAAFYSAERDIMAWSNSPWLTSLHYAFQDSCSLYLVMDYHPGGDLLTIMERKEGGMKEAEARFYLAEIAAGLHDLHDLGFVHRDVKPENVLIARSGHIKLVDFGSAARLDDQGKVIDSQMPVGTPEYISPEVLTSLDKSADYGACCDWWSLGIIAYELLYETTPFEGDTTSRTYSNIMSYKTALSFPGEAEDSEEREARDFISKLLVDMSTRLTYTEIQRHPFFSLTNWNSLLEATPPHIPTVTGPDDVSNFDVFEPLTDDDLQFSNPSHKITAFSGKDLPFIGFTFSNAAEDLTNNAFAQEKIREDTTKSEGELRKSLEQTQKELEEERKKRISLDRECAVYQSQLEDFHRQLEMEKSDRRLSESRAIQLLQEVREKGKIAKQLREEQAMSTEADYGVVMEQLEQDRQEASRRLHRLQERLKEVEKDRDSALKRVADYKNKLDETKENMRKELANLQTRLAKVSKESSSKVEDLQRSLREARERGAETLKKKDAIERSKRRVEADLRKLQAKVDTESLSTKNVNKQLKDSQSTCQELQSKLERRSSASDTLQKQNSFLKDQLKNLEGQLDMVYSGKEHLEQLLENANLEKSDLKASNEKTRQELEAKIQELKKEEAADHMKAKLRSPKGSSKDPNELSKSLKAKFENLRKENQDLKENLFSISGELSKKQKEARELKDSLEKAEQKSRKKLSDSLAEISSLKFRLGEANRKMEEQTTDLSSELHKAELEATDLRKQLQASSAEVEKLAKKLKETEALMESLQNDKELSKKSSQQTVQKLAASRSEAEAQVSHLQKQLKTQELSNTLLQRNMESLGEELKDAKAAVLDAQREQARLKSAKEIIENDLEIAENKLEEMTVNYEKERKVRLETERHLSQVIENTEKLALSHSEELEKIIQQLVAQKELAFRYSTRILELEKEVRLNALSLQETQKQLGIEKTVSSKFYDEVLLKNRELGKLKAAHMKVLSEIQEKSSEITQRDKTLLQLRAASEEHQLQQTRLQATIAQQGKLIDYLQGMGSSPGESRGIGRIKKGLRLGRKGRDPAKEIAEWNKLKGIIAQSKDSGTIGDTSRSSSHHPTATSLSNQTGSNLSNSIPPENGFSAEFSDSGLSLPNQHHHSGSVSSARAPAPSPAHSSSQAPPAPAAQLTKPPSRTPAQTPVSLPTTTTPVEPPPTATSAQLAGTKRKGDSRDLIGQHNIPHKFRGISKSGLLSTHTCAACKGPIKALQKLIKCSHCHVPCHAQCIDKIPNNCGLSPELSSYITDQTLEPAPKKQKQDSNTEPVKVKTTTAVVQPPVPTPPRQETGSKKPQAEMKELQTGKNKRKANKRRPKKGEVVLLEELKNNTDSGDGKEAEGSGAVMRKAASKTLGENRKDKETKSPKNTQQQTSAGRKDTMDTQQKTSAGRKDTMDTQQQTKAGAKNTGVGAKDTGGAMETQQQTKAGAKDSRQQTKAGAKDGRQQTSAGAKDTRGAMETQQQTKAGAKESRQQISAGAKDTRQQTKAGAKDTRQQTSAGAKDTRQQTSAGAKDTRQQTSAGAKDIGGAMDTQQQTSDEGEGNDGPIKFKRHKKIVKRREQNGYGVEVTESSKVTTESDSKKTTTKLKNVDRSTATVALEGDKVIAKPNISDDKSAIPMKITGQDAPIKLTHNIYIGFESSKVIMMERTTHLSKGGLMREGWLVLTRNTLCLYDRDPRGVTRKPIHHFFLNEAGVAYVVEPSVLKSTLPHSSPATLMKAFMFQAYSSKISVQLCVVTESLQSKIEWVEKIQKILSEHTLSANTSPVAKGGYQATPTKLASNSALSTARDLKAVSIVPFSRPSSQFATPASAKRAKLSPSEGSGLDLSIRSSMLNTSSENSFT